MASKNHNLLRTIWRIPILSLVGLSFCIMLLVTGMMYVEYRHQYSKLRSEYIAGKKKIIKREVDRAIETIEYHILQSKLNARDVARERTFRAHSVMANIYNKYKGLKNDDEIKDLIIGALEALRYDNERGYYFITDLNGDALLSPAGSTSGAGQADTGYADRVVEDIIRLVREKGGGHIEYRWTKPAGGSVYYGKISYVMTFKPYGWILGTGIYLDDIEQQARKILLEELSMARYGENGYFFIDKWDGTVLMHGNQPELAGQNMLNYEDSNGVRLVRELIAASKKEDGGFVRYAWRKPDTREELPKITYARGVARWEWLVGTGIYIDDIDKEVARLQSDLKKRILWGLGLIAVVTILSTAGVGFFHSHISRFLTEDFKRFERFLDQAAHSDLEIDRHRIRYEEFDHLAGMANFMLKEKKEAQNRLVAQKERLNVTLRSISDGVISTDINGRVLLMNEIAEELTGQSEARSIGKPIEDLFSLFDSDTNKSLQNPIHKVLEVNEVIEIANHTRLQAKNGIERHIHHGAAPILDRDKALCGVVLVFRDVTERLKKDQENLKLRKLESLGILAGGIAHDFNNILSAILGYSELVKEDMMEMDLPEDMVTSVDRIITSSVRARDLVSQILRFSRSTNEKTYPIQVLLMAKEVTQLLRASLPSYIEIKQDILSQSYVMSDPTNLHQIFMNLCTNAKDAMAENGGILSLSVEDAQVDEKQASLYEGVNPGRFVKIRVADTGHGIKNEHFDKILDPFFTTKEPEKGTGMGLSVVHGIVGKLNGFMVISSEFGKGSVFEVYLPACEKEDTARQNSLIRKENLKGSESILFVDDEIVLTEMFSRSIGSFGYTVTVFSDSETAYEAFKRDPDKFDLVVSDITMPKMTGNILARKILKIRPEIPVILCSGFTNLIDEKRARMASISALIYKPVATEKMLEIIRSILDRR